MRLARKVDVKRAPVRTRPAAPDIALVLERTEHLLDVLARGARELGDVAHVARLVLHARDHHHEIPLLEGDIRMQGIGKAIESIRQNRDRADDKLLVLASLAGLHDDRPPRCVAGSGPPTHLATCCGYSSTILRIFFDCAQFAGGTCTFFRLCAIWRLLHYTQSTIFCMRAGLPPTQSQKTRMGHGALVLNREFPARRVTPANAIVLYVQVLESQVGVLEGLVGGVGARGARGFPAITGTTRTLPAEYRPEALHGEYDGQDNEQ